MKQKLFTLLLAVAASVGTMFASTKIGDLYYNLDATNQTAEVTSQNSSYPYWETTITTASIPASVTYNSVSYSVTSIGEEAFRECTALTSVIIGNNVTSIGDVAFWGCSSLTSVTIPNSVTSIGRSAFYTCESLTSVTIPNSVTSIGEEAFSWCTSLTSINVASDNPNYCSAEGVLFNKDKTKLIQYPVGNTRSEYIIPNSVTSIGNSAFNGCRGLTSVTIPNSVTSIGDRAFRSCRGLTSVTIGNSVQSIGEKAFGRCRGLTSVTIEAETPPTLGIKVFEDCPAEIYVPCGTLETYKTAWPDYGSLIKYAPLSYKISTLAENGSIHVSSKENYTICDELPYYYTLTVVTNYGYHFTQWSDGNTNNPRTVVLTQDTTFTAEFAKNTYTITTQSNNPEWGTTAGDTSALYLDEVEISAIPNYGYHFVRWNDNNTSNPRIVSVTEDKTFTATFAKNVYSITKNAEHGSISGNTSAEYLDYVTLTVTPDYGYHFTQWSDGLKDNPRIAQITQDTTFTAEFAYDRVGTCGKDLALIWSYDPNSKVLTIGNAGEFTENMRFGVEAPNEMEELVIGNSVTAIGENAFAGISSLKKVSIGESVKTIYDRAFYNCVNLETIFNYRSTPSNAYSTAFDGVDKFDCKLYVLPSSIDMYKNASVWRDFYYTYAIGAEETTITTNDVQVEPQDNAATLTWPTNNDAATYTLQITKDGVVFCTLIFNGAGQLIGIAFAPSREGTSHVSTALLAGNGMQFTVTGLNSGTHYAFNLTTKDSQDAVIASYSGEFTTTNNGGGGTTAIDNVNSATQSVGTTKFLRNGQLFIQRGNELFNAQGARVE